jgi:Ca-activated chloride channel family protein
MRGFDFPSFNPMRSLKAGFEELLKLFLELLNYTSGDAGEALAWMNELDKQYNITNDDYGMGDFIDELKQKGYLDEDKQNGEFRITGKTEQSIRQAALEEIFGKLKKSGKGNHRSPQSGQGDEKNAERREFEFGDSLDQIRYDPIYPQRAG